MAWTSRSSTRGPKNQAHTLSSGVMVSFYGSLSHSLPPCVVTGPEPRTQVQSGIPVCHAAQALPSWACRQTKVVDARSVFLFGEKGTAPGGAWPKTLQITTDQVCLGELEGLPVVGLLAGYLNITSKCFPSTPITTRTRAHTHSFCSLHGTQRQESNPCCPRLGDLHGKAAFFPVEYKQFHRTSTSDKATQ